MLIENQKEFSLKNVATEYTFFYTQLDFSSELGVDNEISENEPKSCLTVALFYS